MSLSSLPRGWLLGFSLWFTSTSLLYVTMSRNQQEQSWQVEQLRQEVAALHTVASACRAEGRLAAGPAQPGGSQLSPDDVDLVAARVLTWLRRGEERSEATYSAQLRQRP
jgi:hypothetical protein